MGIPQGGGDDDMFDASGAAEVADAGVGGRDDDDRKSAAAEFSAISVAVAEEASGEGVTGSAAAAGSTVGVGW